jgi:hypothetical protein
VQLAIAGLVPFATDRYTILREMDAGARPLVIVCQDQFQMGRSKEMRAA